MKTFIYLSLLFTTLFTASHATAQKYKYPADTVKLNKEYLDVSNEIAALTAKLTVAQNDLPGVRDRAGAADSRAQNAAENSSDRADKATDGSVKDAKRAKRSARTAYKKAKTSQSADANVNRQERKIAKLNSQLTRKQKRLEDLNRMRTAILNTLPQQQ